MFTLKKFRIKNIIFLLLLTFLFVEVLIIFPSKLEKIPDDSPVRTTLSGDVLQSTDNPKSEDENSDSKAMQKMKGVHLVESQFGKKDWELFSEMAEGSQGKGSWNLKKVKVFFYSQDKVEYTVSGDEGAIDSATKDLRIRGHVVTKSVNGYVFETPDVYYNASIRQIESPSFVKMYSEKNASAEGIALTGDSMVAFVDQSKMIIKKNVAAEKLMSDGKKLRVQAESAQFNGKNQEASFSGNVLMDYDKMKVEGPEAAFLYGSSGNILSNIKVTGGVKASDLDKFASSESLDMDLLQKKFTFKGKPKVIQNDDELSGEEITFLDGGKRVKVNKVNARMEK